MKIQLNNNQWYPAVRLPGDTFSVELTRGVKIYSMSQIRRIEEDDQDEILDVVNESDTNKEDPKMKIFHYMQHVANIELPPDEDGKVDVVPMYRRTITTSLDATMLAKYEQSAETHRVVGDTLAISTGNWHLHLLQNRLADRGVDFRIEVYDHYTYTKQDNADQLITDKINDPNCTFAYANATGAVYFYGATLKELGLTATHAKKLAKRLMETTRMTEMALHLPEERIGEITVGTFIIPPGMDPKLFDGISFIRRSLVLRACRVIEDPIRRRNIVRGIKDGSICRLMVRFLTDGWLMKGDIIIVPDYWVTSDIVTVDDNLKSEIRTNGFAHLSLWEHHPRHTAVWDVQSTVNFSQALPAAKEMHDIDRLYNQLVESLSTGKLPSWQLLGDVAHNDDGTVNMEKLSARVRTSHLRLQAELGEEAGSTLLQNAMFMAWNGTERRMKASPLMKSRITGIAARKKQWIPMSNAVLGSVVTYEALTMMGGFEFPNQDPDKVFWDDRVGLVIPGQRFIETYALHGGWDQDDSIKAIWVKVFATEDITHLYGNVLPSGVVIPSKPEDAIDMLLMVRSPNGPGEYSLELFNPEGMFDEDMLDPEWITTFNLSRMPLPQMQLLSGVTVTGMPFTTVYTKTDLDKVQMIEMVLAQTKNPGVGAYCNAIMVYWYTMRKFPKVLLDVMETVVDTLQQGYDLTAFEAIEEETQNIWTQLLRACKGDPTKRIELTLATTRMNSELQMRFAGLFQAGRFTTVHRHYEATIAKMSKAMEETTGRLRWENPIVRRLAQRPFDQQYTALVKERYHMWTNHLVAIDAEKKEELKAITNPITGKPNPFGAMVIQENASIRMHEVVSGMVKYFEDITDERERYIRVVNLYKWIVLAQNRNIPKYRYGVSDRIFFQPNAAGEKSLMDILIEGIKYFKLV